MILLIIIIKMIDTGLITTRTRVGLCSHIVLFLALVGINFSIRNFFLFTLLFGDISYLENYIYPMLIVETTIKGFLTLYITQIGLSLAQEKEHETSLLASFLKFTRMCIEKKIWIIKFLFLMIIPNLIFHFLVNHYSPSFRVAEKFLTILSEMEFNNQGEINLMEKIQPEELEQIIHAIHMIGVIMFAQTFVCSMFCLIEVLIIDEFNKHLEGKANNQGFFELFIWGSFRRMRRGVNFWGYYRLCLRCVWIVFISADLYEIYFCLCIAHFGEIIIDKQRQIKRFWLRRQNQRLLLQEKQRKIQQNHENQDKKKNQDQEEHDSEHKHENEREVVDQKSMQEGKVEQKIETEGEVKEVEVEEQKEGTQKVYENQKVTISKQNESKLQGRMRKKKRQALKSFQNNFWRSFDDEEVLYQRIDVYQKKDKKRIRFIYSPAENNVYIKC